MLHSRFACHDYVRVYGCSVGLGALKFSLLMIVMDICKAPTLRLKALNKHSITHIMYIEMEMLSAKRYIYI